MINGMNGILDYGFEMRSEINLKRRHYSPTTMTNRPVQGQYCSYVLFLLFHRTKHTATASMNTTKSKMIHPAMQLVYLIRTPIVQGVVTFAHIGYTQVFHTMINCNDGDIGAGEWSLLR